MSWVFVRGLESPSYGLMGELRRLRAMPRVIKTKELPWVGGPQGWHKFIIEPATSPSQTMYIFQFCMVPGGRSQKHGHQNEALFYILEGKGYAIHDGERYDWEAGDAIIVHLGSVHQFFNTDPQKPAKALILNPKPLYIFLNLMAQKEVIPPADKPIPGWENFWPADLPGR